MPFQNFKQDMWVKISSALQTNSPTISDDKDEEAGSANGRDTFFTTPHLLKLNLITICQTLKQEIVQMCFLFVCFVVLFCKGSLWLYHFLAAVTFAFCAPTVFLISTSQFRKQTGTWEYGIVK